jgi:hypothetical protein
MWLLIIYKRSYDETLSKTTRKFYSVVFFKIANVICNEIKQE